MKRLIAHLVVALLTFIIGVSAGMVWDNYRMFFGKPPAEFIDSPLPSVTYRR